MVAILLLGGNLGNRDAYLRFALFHLKKNVGKVLQISKVYESGAWGKIANKPFLNQVVKISTHLSPQELLDAILFIEELAGRKRTLKWGNRTLDIDILYIEDKIINEPGLKVPHPEIQNRAFTLVPLAEIQSNFVHPILKQTTRNLLINCADTVCPKEYKKRGV